MIPASSFTRSNLTPAELSAGTVLSTLNLAVIQNLRVDIAEQKLNLTFTPNDVLSYTQQEAFLKGQLEILQHLIDTSAASSTLAAQPHATSNSTRESGE